LSRSKNQSPRSMDTCSQTSSFSPTFTWRPRKS
jgi:hypothetical protein